MFKTVISASVMLAATLCMSSATAGVPYVGGSLGVGKYYSQNGVIGNLFAGYGITGGPSQLLYLASELNVNAAHYQSYKTIYGYGLSLIPGLAITQNFMFYGRAGLNAEYPYQTYKYSRYGSHLGAGMQIGFDRNWAMRLEYTRLITLESNTYNLGFLYKFN